MLIDSRSFLRLPCSIFLQLTNQMWFSVVCTLIDNDMRHHSGQDVVDRRSRVSPQQILTAGMTHIVVDKSTVNAKPHAFDMFFTTISTSKKMFFQSVTKSVTH